MIVPNFFIVGAPKCGTTALSQYLSDHPDIFISTPKEPLFYLLENDSYRKIIDAEHYKSLFKGAEDYSRIGEASVWYLYSESALKNIKRNHDGAKIIIMKREAASFVASLHSQLVFSGEEVDDLETAWFREKRRLQDVDIAQLRSLESLSNWKCAYPELANQKKYIDCYKSTFGKDNVLVVDQEDFIENPKKIYTDVLVFLGVDDDNRNEFPVINANKKCRFNIIRSFLNVAKRSERAISFSRSLKKILGLGSFGICLWIEKKNSVASRRDPIPDHLKNEINNSVN